MIANRDANFHEMDAQEVADLLNLFLYDGEQKITQIKFFPLSRTERDCSDSVPLCSFGQGEYTKPFYPSGQTGIICRLWRLTRKVFNFRGRK